MVVVQTLALKAMEATGVVVVVAVGEDMEAMGEAVGVEGDREEVTIHESEYNWVCHT